MQLSRRFPIGSLYSDKSIISNSFRTRHNSRSSIWEGEWVRSYPVKGPGFNPGQASSTQAFILNWSDTLVAISIQWMTAVEGCNVNFRSEKTPAPISDKRRVHPDYHHHQRISWRR